MRMIHTIVILSNKFYLICTWSRYVKSCWDLLTRQHIEPDTQLELHELNYGISSLIISHQNDLIIAGGKDGGVAFIDRDSFEVMKTHKFNSLGTVCEIFLWLK